MASSFRCIGCGQRVNISPQMGQVITCPMCKTEQLVGGDGSDESGRTTAEQPVGGQATIAEPIESAPTPTSYIEQSRPIDESSDRRGKAFEDVRDSRSSEDSGIGGTLLTIGCALVLLVMVGLAATGIYMLFFK